MRDVQTGLDASRPASRGSPWRRVTLKRVTFAAFGLMTLFVAWNNERFFLTPQAPEWAHYGPIRWHLLPHGIAGLLALACGALQFSGRIRRRYVRLHRVSGRVYLVGTFVAAPVAIRMAFINSPWFLVPFTIVQAGTWMLFTLVAFLCIRRGDTTAHREWMTRSYAIVLIFLEGRVLMAIPALARHGMDAIVLVNWACLAVSLVVTECVLRWNQIVPPRRQRRGTAVPLRSATPQIVP
jgi:uncharacterized membrane protein